MILDLGRMGFRGIVGNLRKFLMLDMRDGIY